MKTEKSLLKIETVKSNTEKKPQNNNFNEEEIVLKKNEATLQKIQVPPLKITGYSESEKITQSNIKDTSLNFETHPKDTSIKNEEPSSRMTSSRIVKAGINSRRAVVPITTSVKKNILTSVKDSSIVKDQKGNDLESSQASIGEDFVLDAVIALVLTLQ